MARRQFLQDLDATDEGAGRHVRRSLDPASARVRFATWSEASPERSAGALSAGAASHDVQALLIEELELPPSPTVLVLEDVHWADDATLDSITVLGRRIGALPALLVLTFRAGEAPPGHRLHATIGAIRAEDSVVVELAPLSQRAVTDAGRRRRGQGLRRDRGNPFYVTELLASRTAIRAATIGRQRGDRARPRASTTPRAVWSSWSRSCRAACKTSLLDAVMPDWAASAEEPERRQLLEVDSTYVRFRHELARHAIRSSIPIAARRRLHAEILDGSSGVDADPADIVHHAEAAGAEDVVADYALDRRTTSGGARVEPGGVLPLPPGRRRSSIDDRRPSKRRCSRSSRRPHISSTGIDEALHHDRAGDRRCIDDLGR